MSKSESERIAVEAERDVNTYQAKTGNARVESIDEAGVNSNIEKTFANADVRYGADLKAVGHDSAPRADEDGDTSRQRQHLGPGHQDNILKQGQKAVVANIGRADANIGGSQFKGEDYYTPESVPDSIAAEGNVPPPSVLGSSKGL